MKHTLLSIALLVTAVATWLAVQAYWDPKEYSTNGIWSGQFDINGRGQYDFTALYIDGEAVAVSNDTNMLYYGRIDNKQEQYESQLVMYLKNHGRKFGEVELNGVFASSNKIDAEFLTVGAKDKGKLLLENNPSLFYQDIPIEKFIGQWILYKGMIILKFNISPNGHIRGADTTGCEYEGSIKQKKSGINAYKLHFFLSSCNYLDGEMYGTAYASTSLQKNDTLNMYLFNSESGLFLPVVRDQNKISEGKELKPL